MTMAVPNLPIPTRWITNMPGIVRRPPMALGSELCVRADNTLVWLDQATGKVRTSLELGYTGIKLFLLALGDRVLVDRTPAGHETTLVDVVRKGKVERTFDTGCIVSLAGAALLGSELYVLGTIPAGTILRSFDPATGARRVDERVVPDGRDLFTLGDRLLILNSTGEPGLFTLDGNGKDARTFEQTSVQNAEFAAGRVLLSARVGPAPLREARMRDLATGEILWTAPAHGSMIGLDAEIAVHVEKEGEDLVPVARDALNGEVKWKGSALAAGSGEFSFLGPHIGFWYGYGFQLFRRTDGTLVGDIEDGMGATIDGVMYIGGDEWFARVA